MAGKFAPSKGKVIEDKIPREFLFHYFEKNLSGAGRQTGEKDVCVEWNYWRCLAVASFERDGLPLPQLKSKSCILPLFLAWKWVCFSRNIIQTQTDRPLANVMKGETGCSR